MTFWCEAKSKSHSSDVPNRRYAAVNVSYEYEEARILEGMGKAGVPEE